MRVTPLFVMLLCGLPVAPAVALENFPPALVAYLNRQGPVTSITLLHSVYPAPQMAVYYCVDEGLKGGKNEGANNAANTYCAVALFNRGRGGKWFFGDEIDIGQGSIKAFSNGLVLGESVKYGNEDANCCPSIRTQLRFNTARGKLVSVAE